MFLGLWRVRPVSLRICKASWRSSKFRLPVADLRLSSFFLPRPPSVIPSSSLPCCFFFSSFLALIEPCAFLIAHLSARLTSRRLMDHRKSTRSRKDLGGCSIHPSLSSSHLLPHRRFRSPLRSFSVCVRCAPTARGGSSLLRTSDSYLPNYIGVGFLRTLGKSPWARHEIRIITFETFLSICGRSLHRSVGASHFLIYSEKLCTSSFLYRLDFWEFCVFEVPSSCADDIRFN